MVTLLYGYKGKLLLEDVNVAKIGYYAHFTSEFLYTSYFVFSILKLKLKIGFQHDSNPYILSTSVL